MGHIVVVAVVGHVISGQVQVGHIVGVAVVGHVTSGQLGYVKLASVEMGSEENRMYTLKC